MGKPLLTDEIIDQANRGELPTESLDRKPQETTRSFFRKTRQPDDGYIYKSRRIENAKRGQFQKKLNIAIVVIALLLFFLFYAVFNL